MTVGLLLAAGEGQRLGHGPKALLRAPDADSLVRRAVTTLLDGGCDRVVVVAGAGADEVRAELSTLPCHLVVNPAWSSGLASSFAAGVAEAARLGASRVLVALVDQPGLNPGAVEYLLHRAAPSRATAAAYDGERGHPLLLPLAFAQEAAAQATGDAGAREWLRAHPELVDLVELGHLADGRDIDTPADLAAWREAR